MAKPRISLEEQEEILLVAKGLLAEPDSWMRGQWKCPAVHVENKSYKQKTDENGQPLYQYCIQGAINQATYDVLGEERALKLGAVKYGPDKELNFQGTLEVMNPTRSLGLNRIAKKLFGASEAMAYNDSPSATHEGVLSILSTRLKEVRSRMKREATIKERSNS